MSARIRVLPETWLKPFPTLLLLLVLAAAGVPSANAGLTINANFTTPDTVDFPGSSTISQAPNAAAVEASILSALTQITSQISTPMTITINFLNDPNAGLGASVDTGHMDIPFSQYVSLLTANPKKSASDTAAIASLNANPYTAATKISLGGANLVALGDTTDGNTLIGNNKGFAGTVALNLSVLNSSRSPYNPAKYDIISTVTHEVDEVLGIGGQGSTLGQGTGNFGALDLYRYRVAGTRSYTTSASAVSYFSINGGVTNLVNFNQDSTGDYADWQGNAAAQVQDAFAGPDAEPNIGPNELTALDVVGYTLAPEPGSLALLATGLIALAGRRRHRFR